MKKNGYTLIEILAVIVVIAVIAVITVPLISGIIMKARKASYKDSIYGIIESARIYQASNITSIGEKEIEFVCDGTSCKRENGDILNFRGSVPKSGSIYIKGNEILIESVYNGKYYANNETGEVVITEEDSTLTRGELTELIKKLQEENQNLKIEIDKKADKIEVENVNKIATTAHTLASNAATKSELQSLSNTVNTKVTMIEALKAAYPVGSIYMTLTNVDPGTLFGGTWERIQDRFLLGVGNHYAINSTGGEATHTLTVDEIPDHVHGIYYGTNGTGSNVNNVVALSSQSTANGAFPSNHMGGGLPHNNLPPYLAVYMWKRIS